MTAVRKDPPRRWKLPVWLAMAAVAWLALAVVWMAWQAWPWPTCVVLALVSGFLAGVVWGRRPLPDVELVHERKDLAIDAAMGTAFQLQQISGEQPTVDVEMYVQTDEETLDQPPVEAFLYEHDREYRAEVDRLRYLESQPTANDGIGPWSGASHLLADPADDTGTGTIAHLRSGEWAPAAPAPKQVGQ